jgi:23S rRNA (pseudouridine1915-N3)-methyltransferase
MAMHPITILTVGSIKKPFWQHAAQHYQRCLRALVRLEVISLPEGKGGTPPKSALFLVGLQPRHRLIVLHEKAPLRTSPQMATLLAGLWDAGAVPCFAIGGPTGLPCDLEAKAWTSLSLGPLTLPHELAYIILLEQIYRSAAILNGKHYHY